MTKQRFSFTGEELAKAHLWHLTRDERDKYHKENKTRTKVHSESFLSDLRRRIGLSKRKIYLVEFKSNGGFIIMADDEKDACVQAVPFLTDQLHSCKEPHYDDSCKECVSQLDELADRLNHSSVRWLGWGQPDFNWIIHV